jgi:hypothetical protein
VSLIKSPPILKDIRQFNRDTEGLVEYRRDMRPGKEREEVRADWIKRRAEGRRSVLWWREQHALREAEWDRVGRPAPAAEEDRLNAEISEVGDRISSTPAGSIEGILIKLRLFAAVTVGPNGEEDNLNWSNSLVLTVLHDAERLTGAT